MTLFQNSVTITTAIQRTPTFEEIENFFTVSLWGAARLANPRTEDYRSRRWWVPCRPLERGPAMIFRRGNWQPSVLNALYRIFGYEQISSDDDTLWFKGFSWCGGGVARGYGNPEDEPWRAIEPGAPEPGDFGRIPCEIRCKSLTSPSDIEIQLIYSWIISDSGKPKWHFKIKRHNEYRRLALRLFQYYVATEVQALAQYIQKCAKVDRPPSVRFGTRGTVDGAFVIDQEVLNIMQLRDFANTLAEREDFDQAIKWQKMAIERTVNEQMKGRLRAELRQHESRSS